jgi:hypothetical protein
MGRLLRPGLDGGLTRLAIAHKSNSSVEWIHLGRCRFLWRIP